VDVVGRSEYRKKSCIETILDTQIVSTMINRCIDMVKEWIDYIEKCYEDSDGIHVETKSRLKLIIPPDYKTSGLDFKALMIAIQELKARGKCK
jgi:hypothetical protein